MSDERCQVAHVGPAPQTGGGMSAVIGALLESSLASRYGFVAIHTYDSARPARRAVVFAISLLRLACWCAGRGSRIVHIHATVRGSMHRKAACVVVAKALGRPVVLHVHAGAGDLAVFHRRLGTLRRRAFRAVLHLADRVLSVSAPSAHELEERFGAPRVDVLPNAAPPAVSLNGRAPQVADGNLLYVGGFANPVKGGEVLLEALPLILRELPLARVVLAGPGEPPQRVKELGPRVAAVGWLDAEQKARAIKEAQVFVLPSTSEGLPVALLEAMAYGKPIVASAVGGIPDVVTAGVEALLVPAGRPDALAEAILTLAGDDELRKRLARGALAAAQRLSPRVVDEKLEAVYGALSR